MPTIKDAILPSASTLPDDPLTSARAAVAALDLLGLPAAALGRGAHVLAANERFEALMRPVAGTCRSALRLTDPAARTLLGEALEHVASSRARVRRAIPIPAAAGRPPMVVHVIAVAGATRRRSLSGMQALVVVATLVPKDVPATATLQGLLDLTPAEARVARGVVEGQTIEAMAVAFGLSRETVRSQLKATLGKTGVARQSELALMLAQAGLPWPAEDP